MILVTGGCGFIGSAFILEWFKATGEPVVNLDLLTYAGRMENLAEVHDHPSYSFVHGDVGDAKLMRDLLAMHRPRAVVHIAAETHVDRSIEGPMDFVHTNVVGTSRMLQAVQAYWESLPAEAQHAFRFLNVSTDEVYGSLAADAPAFTEKHRFEPNSPYSASKAAADHFVRAWHHTYRLPTLSTHCSNNYGPRQFPEKLIPLMIHHALAGKPLPVYGDGLNVRDWLHVDDHCSAIRAVLARGKPGESYNVGGRAEKTNIELVQLLCRTLDEMRPRADGRSYSSQIAYVTDRKGHDRRYAIDDTKIATELGWQPAVKFEDGIRRTVAWYLERLR
jgi:dTDP-glucose 4,6-dehydratase